MTKKDFVLKAMEYEKINEDIKKLTKIKSALNADIKDELQKFGTLTSTGSIVFEEVYADKTIKVTNTCRTSSTLVSDAEELLRKNKKLEFLEEVTIVRNDRLQEAISRGELKATLVDDLYNISETFALTISVKNS